MNKEVGMKRDLRVLAAAGVLVAALTLPDASFAQKSGGTLKIGHFDSPASMSMLEESTVAVNRPMMGVFNNLVMFKQDEPQNTPESIVPGTRHRVALERGRHRTDLPAAPGRQVA